MGGPRLLGFALGLALNGNAPTRVLKPDLGGVTLPDGGAGLQVSDAAKARAVRRFLRG
jgi:hypothetical protein